MINIQGNRIFLKTFTRDECHQFWKAYVPDPVMDPNPYEYVKEKVDKRYDSMIEKESWYPRVGIFLWDKMPIGELSFKRINYEKSQCELGIALANDKYKSLGYGTEAFQMAIDYVFYTLGLQHIYADTMGSNFRMQSIFNRFGFELISIDQNYYDMHDRWEDRLNYVLKKG